MRNLDTTTTDGLLNNMLDHAARRGIAVSIARETHATIMEMVSAGAVLGASLALSAIDMMDDSHRRSR